MKKGLQWLKTMGCVDAKAEGVIKRLVRGNRKFLVLGNTASGKHTLAEALYGHMHDTGKNPVLLPTIVAKDFAAACANRNWKIFSGALRQGVPAVMPVGYGRTRGFEYYIPELPRIGKYFDVVLDIRKLAGGKRVLCQIFLVHGGRPRCVYRHPSIATYSDTNSVAA